MDDNPYNLLEETIEAEGVAAAFDRLAAVLRARKQYPQLFEALLMKKRHELGLPLAGTDSISDLPESVQDEVEHYYIDVCREVGGLFLADGDVRSAWPYFRAIEESDPVGEAVAAWQPPGETEDETQLALLDDIINIALHEGANPRRGFELVLSEHGVCRAITVFEHQFPYKGEVREACGRMLVERLHADLSAVVRADVDGRCKRDASLAAPPADTTLRDLLEANPWLFEGMGHHVDVSHLMSVIRVAGTTHARDLLEKGLELADYGRRLGRDFQHPDPPPFEDFYNDYRIFLRALLGQGVDGALRYFAQVAERHGLDEEGRHFPGEVLVYLLHRTGRHAEAIAAFEKHLEHCARQTTIAPSLRDLCEALHDYRPMLAMARRQDNLLDFTAGLVHRRGVDTAD